MLSSPFPSPPGIRVLNHGRIQILSPESPSLHIFSTAVLDSPGDILFDAAQSYSLLQGSIFTAETSRILLSGEAEFTAAEQRAAERSNRVGNAEQVIFHEIRSHGNLPTTHWSPFEGILALQVQRKHPEDLLWIPKRGNLFQTLRIHHVNQVSSPRLPHRGKRSSMMISIDL